MLLPHALPRAVPRSHGVIAAPARRRSFAAPVAAPGAVRGRRSAARMAADGGTEARMGADGESEVRVDADGGPALLFPAAQVYCNDALLRVVQLAAWRPHEDSKTLVDLPLRVAPARVLALFAALGDAPSAAAGRAFLAASFHADPDEALPVAPCVPEDYTEDAPAFVHALPPRAGGAAAFAADLKRRWLRLCRRFADFAAPPAAAAQGSAQDVAQRFVAHSVAYDARSSLLPLPHPFFVPGGRFREVYYWDSLWIVHGLLAADMVPSAVGVVRNLLYLVRMLGFVPNGNRLYYLNRSQPPVLPEAVRAVFDALGTEGEKRAWLEETLPVLEREYCTFLEGRRAGAEGPHAALAVYRANLSSPRPESYAEDVATAARANGKEARWVFQDIASGAESGWDFSSRWLQDGQGLESIRTSKIVPVCLNSVLLRSEKLFAEFHTFLEQTGDAADDEDAARHRQAAEKYTGAAERTAQAMTAVLWSEAHGMWMDYDTGLERQTGVVSCAGVMPLWAGAWEGRWTEDDAKRFVRNLMNGSGLVQRGGVAATTVASQEQWDFPNCWPPLVDLVVSGLRKVHAAFPAADAGAAAEEIAMRAVRNMYRGWESSAEMHEKYDADKGDGSNGDGGEYASQDGFGWTNGVALKLMKEYTAEIAQAEGGRWLS